MNTVNTNQILDPKLSQSVERVSRHENPVHLRQTSEDFRKTLQEALQPAKPSKAFDSKGVASEAGRKTLHFSAHAVDRMKSRGISFDSELMKSIEMAIGKAAAKGSKDTLVLAGDNALIVSVKNNTVVTVMDRAAMRENVFTNIDSTVVV